jgi:hypothetical protein
MFIKIFSIQILLQQKVAFSNSTSDQSTTGSNHKTKKNCRYCNKPKLFYFSDGANKAALRNEPI